MQLACVTGQERHVLKGHYSAKEKKQAKTEGSLPPFWSTPLIIFLQLPCTEDGGCYSCIDLPQVDFTISNTTPY